MNVIPMNVAVKDFYLNIITTCQMDLVVNKTIHNIKNNNNLLNTAQMF